MNYEKAYKEALERARKLYNDAKVLEYTQDMEDYETIFPELKESEDERIRKALVRFHKSTIDVDGIKGEDIVAWLEKQGEQKVPINDFKAKNWYVSEVDGKIHDMTYNPTDKVEPKFKVDDWIANDYCTGKVIALTDDAYLLDSGQGIPFSCEHNAHLWTIDDAKDGDVLACGDKVTDCPFIFHNLTEELNPRSYCGVNTSGDFQYNDENGGFWCKSDEVRPATKEQRDTLFKAMTEAGYTFDFEKKELKLLISNGGDFESNNSKQKPTWSDEDETLLYEIVDYFNMDDALRHTENEIIDWLKSLKERLS